MGKQKNKIQIAIPTMGSLRTELATWLLQQEHPVFMTIEISPFSYAMNKIIEVFLINSEAEYLMVVDSDTVPPADAIEKMLAVNADVVTGITPVKKGNKKCINVYENYEDIEGCVEYFDDTKPFPVVGMGSSCLLIKRSLLKKMKKPYFKHIEFDDGKICTGEMYFCDMIKQAGGTIMCEPSVKCQHFKNVGMELE